MDRIIPSKPAKYPSTNVSESRAINIFKYILSEYVKTDIHQMDKIPNYDGHLEITNESYEPIGKIEVQMKGISDGFSGEPKYQCSLHFLSHCEISTIPVFLILVDIENEVAYWLFISRELLKDIALRIKPGSESISVKIPSKNIIRQGNAEYLLEWKEIIEDFRIKIWYYDLLKEEHTNLEKAHNILKQENSLVGIEKPEFINIHKFLDSLNLYLDADFSIIKDLYYNSCWKLGIAYNNYSEDHLTYLLYPINYNKNDLQIREISDKLKDEIRKESNDYAIRTFPSKNPIHIQPENYAKELVINTINEICEKKLLPLSHISLFREVIFKFIDKFHDCLGLQIKDSYTIQEIKHAFNTYLPVWVDEVLSNENVNLGIHPLNSPFIDPDFLLVQLNHEKRKEIDKRVKERIKNNQLNTMELILGNKKFPLKLISNFLDSSFLKDLKEIKRLYIPPNFERPTSSNYIWSFYSPEEVFENTMIFFEEFNRVYDTTIDSCFPKLKQKLNFFNDFDTLVVVVKTNDNYTNFDRSPSIECYNLKSEEASPGNEIKFYMKNRDNIPISREMDLESKIEIDGKSYTVKSASWEMLNFIFEDLPMFNYLYMTLKEKIKDFFKYNE